ncbi:MAG: PqqD family protein [Bacteroidaceae bacterium]|nr:PqqD family protein [Bacteroidaceae bacterium]
MRIKEGFELREMCGEHIIIATGVANIDFSTVISLNESAAWLWRMVEGKEFTPETLAEMLMQQYEVDEATALTDAEALANRWVNVGIVAK